jgi:hypothetical protein
VVKAQEIAWTKELEPELIPVLNDDLPAIREEVKKGISQLWRVDGRGLVITRIEENALGQPDELVFIAGIGKDAKPVIKHFAFLVNYNFGVKKMRIHSQRQGMERYLSSLGFGYSETVYKGVIDE